MAASLINPPPKKAEESFDDWLFRLWAIVNAGGSSATVGTWTPTITFATPGDLSVAYSTQLGTYWKSGGLVVAWLELATSSFTHTTASGNFRIAGLPFAAAAISGSAANYYGPPIAFQGITKANYTQYTLSLVTGQSFAGILASGSAQTLDSVQAASVATGSSVIIRGFLGYYAG